MGKVLTVSDANVIIDIEVGKLTKSMFRLRDISFYIPDVLFEQELRERHSHLLKLGLHLCILSSDSIKEIWKLTQLHSKKISSLDFFALQLAREKSCILLTGDRRLCKVAREYDIKCHGTIWLIEQMLKQSIIQLPVARKAYNQMIVAGSRLPLAEINISLEKFSVVSI